MTENLTSEEVATVIRARQIERKAGLDRGVDVKTLCECAGVSRKTGYEWVKKAFGGPGEKEKEVRLDYDRLKAEHEKLTSDFEQIRLENEGRKIAWEIHRVDELLKKKRPITGKRRKKRL
jgi:hypothetical protein